MKKIDITALTKIRGGEYQDRTESGFTQTPRLAGGSHLRQGLLSGEDPGPASQLSGRALLKIFGGPWGTRTPDPLRARQVL
jgi:hypothetical protein